ncbi:MAG: type II toxin-antitoxin system ParD family antitoxin [Rhizobiaceae bacterium]|nr:type II toxin-antitoxin system ParD family antitoxin [Rhizobiaceae bacterium]
MYKNTSIMLGDQLDKFIGAQIGTGRYGSASEVVRAGLRLLEERETKLQSLRAALIEGEQSGDASEFDVEGFLSQKHANSSKL